MVVHVEDAVVIEIAGRGGPAVVEVFELLRAESRRGLLGRRNPAREILDRDVLEPRLAAASDVESDRPEVSGGPVDCDRTAAAVDVGAEDVHVDE